MAALGKRSRQNNAPDASSGLEQRASMLSLPDEVIDHIGRYLWLDRDAFERGNVQQKDIAALSWTCRRLQRLFLPYVWQSIRLLVRWDALETAESILRSEGRGEFVDSVIVEFDGDEEVGGLDDLLQTVLDACSSLKHLELSAVRLGDDCASAAVIETVSGGLRRSMRRVETFRAWVGRPVTPFAKALDDLLGNSRCLTSLTLTGRETEVLDEEEEETILDRPTARALRDRIGTLSHLDHLSIDLDVFRGLIRGMRKVPPRLTKVELPGYSAEDNDILNLCSLAAPSLETLILFRGLYGRPRPIYLPRLRHLSFIAAPGRNPLSGLIHPFSPLRHYTSDFGYVDMERDVASFYEAQRVKTLRRISLSASDLAFQMFDFSSLTDDEDNFGPVLRHNPYGPLKAWGDRNAVVVDLQRRAGMN